MDEQDADELFTNFCPFVNELDPAELNKGKRRVCEDCKRPKTVCWCPYLPAEPLKVRTHIYILQHPFEETRGLRTVPMLTRCLVPEQVTVLRGKRFSPNKYPELAAVLKQPNTLLLYPGPDATDLSLLASTAHHHHPSGHNQPAEGLGWHFYRCETGRELSARSSSGFSTHCREGDGQLESLNGGQEISEKEDSLLGQGHILSDNGQHVSHGKTLIDLKGCVGCSCDSATPGKLYCDNLAESHLTSGKNQLNAQKINTISVGETGLHTESNIKIQHGQNHHKSKDRDLQQNDYNLVLLDGTWAQAKGLYCQNEMVKWPRKVQIHHDEKSKYVIRTQPTDGALSTLETAAIALSVLENRPEIIEILTRPLIALCEFQLAHGAVRHHSREYKVEHGLWTKPLPRALRMRLERLKNQQVSHGIKPAS